MARMQSQRDNALRVSFVTPGLSCGGAERWVVSLARHFSSAVRVTGFMSGGKGPLSKEAQKIARVYHQLEAGEMLANTDVLIAWGWEKLPELTATFKGRIVAVSHGEPGGEWQDRVTAAMATTPRVELVGVSSRSLDAWPNRGTGIYIPNGVEVDRVTPRRGREATRKDLGISDHQKVAMFIGRLSPEKRPWLMHEMLPHLPDNWVSVVCGPDTMGYTVGAYGKERLIVVPPVEYPGDLLAAADVFILPSETEAHPMALTEAWLAGVPTVYCDWPFAQQIRDAHQDDLGNVCAVELDGMGLGWTVEYAETDANGYVSKAREAAWKNYTAGAMASRWEDFLGVGKPVAALVHG